MYQAFGDIAELIRDSVDQFTTVLAGIKVLAGRISIDKEAMIADPLGYIENMLKTNIFAKMAASTFESQISKSINNFIVAQVVQSTRAKDELMLSDSDFSIFIAVFTKKLTSAFSNAPLEERLPLIQIHINEASASVSVLKEIQSKWPNSVPIILSSMDASDKIGVGICTAGFINSLSDLGKAHDKKPFPIQLFKK